MSDAFFKDLHCAAARIHWRRQALAEDIENYRRLLLVYWRARYLVGKMRNNKERE
jgi:hypothetical protein